MAAASDFTAVLTGIVGAEQVLTGERIGPDYGHDEALAGAPAVPAWAVCPGDAEQVAAIKTIVEQAKSVPMSASCMLNRAEVVGLLDRALSTLSAEAEVARRDSSADAISEARAEADRIVADARARAEELVSSDAVHTEAVAKASELSATTQSETDALKREADAYVDQRMAELEAYMAKTLSQLKTMRARLSQRSGLDEPERSAFDEQPDA